jgi:hypothetical protein
MLRHCVFFKWADGATDEAKSTISAGLDEMAALDMMEAYSHGPDAGLSDGNWDYVVVGDFADVDAYRAYSADASHQALIVEHIRPNITDRAAVQYEI